MIVTRENIIHLANTQLYLDKPVFNANGKYRELATNVTYVLSNGKHLIIKAGFRWDEASIPFVFQPLFPKSGVHAFAALPHDALYYLTQTSKRFADNEYAYWMMALGVSSSQIRWRWWAVEKFGGRWWKKNETKPSELCIYNRNFLKLI
jgi:hypothetical protein